MFNKIIVGFDGSETSENALRTACDIAQKYNSEIHLIHSPEPQTVAFALGVASGYDVVTTMPSPEEVKIAADKIIDSGTAIIKDFNQTATNCLVKSGNPAENIVDYAKECDADLIVTGRRGVGSLSALVLGSTTQRINHLAECACLSIG